MKFIGFFLFCLGMGIPSARADVPDELFFPVERSKVQVLPQRFEYTLMNKDQIRIGNLLIDANQIDFQLIPLNEKANRYRLRFRWPAEILNEGEIAIKDNSGKGIWFQKINPEKLQFSPDKKTVTYETETEVPSLLRLVNFYPFFKFCVHREEPLTQVFLCSKDLFLRKNKENNQVSIISRDAFRPQSFVEINGQAAGDQGMIFLNSPSESIFMRALLLSGATVELGTRMKNVNFKDVYLSPDEMELIVRAQGTEPVDPSTVRRLPNSPDEWETKLAVDRPVTYLKGEGNLPLRQEFLIQGPVRKSEIKVAITSDNSNITFQKDYTLNLQPANGLKLSNVDKRTRLDKTDDDEYRWVLTGLEKNEPNRRYIKVSDGKEEYIAAYDIERRAAFDGRVQLMYPFWAGASMLYTPSMNWGGFAQIDKQLVKGSDEEDLQILTAGLQYRFPSGLHLRDQMYAAEFLAQAFQSGGINLWINSLGFTGELKSPQFYNLRFPWTIFKLRYPFATSDANFKLKPSFEAEVSFRSLLTPTSYWDLGLRTQSYTFEHQSGTDLKFNKSYIFIGKGWVF